MGSLLAILWKDWRIESRRGVQLLPLISFSLLLVSFLGIGVSTFIHDERELRLLFHPLIWGIFLLSGPLTLVRVFEEDRRASTVKAMQLYNVSLYLFYLAKCVFISTLLLMNHLVSSLVLMTFFGIPFGEWCISYVILSALVSIAYASLGSLLSGLAASHSMRYVLFPLVFLPLLFPLFFAVVEVSTSLVFEGSLLGAGGWVSLIIGLTVTYLALGILLFDYVAKE